MRRVTRATLTTVLALCLTAACGPNRPDGIAAPGRASAAARGTTPPAAAGGISPIVHRGTLIAAYDSRYGFTLPQWAVIDIPQLLVFSDGRVVSEATHTLLLGRWELDELVRGLRGQLSGLATEINADRIAVDYPLDIHTVRLADGKLYQVKSCGLGELDGLPEALEDAHATLTGLAKRTTKEGTPYRSDAIRLVVAPTGEVTGTGKAWPAAVAVPPGSRPGSTRSGNLTGAAAQEAMKHFQSHASGAWPTYVLPDGTQARVAWRYIVPSERDIRDR